MSDDSDKRFLKRLHQLRKIKGFGSMSRQDADAAYDAAPALPLPPEKVDALLSFVTAQKQEHRSDDL